MKNLYKVFGISSICLFALSSCEKEIDVDLHSVEPRIVIEGLIAKDSLATVRITKTKDFNADNNFLPVNGALVTISDSWGNVDTLKQNVEGLYVASIIKGVEGTTYSLEISVEDKEYTATSTMPEVTKIEKIEMYYIQSLDYAFPKVYFQDHAGIENYYRANLYLNTIRVDDDNGTVDDKDRDGLMLERILPVFDDDRETTKKVERGDTIFIELQSIDKGVFDYFETLDNIDNAQTNPTNNIKGGALGYFNAYASDTMTIIADWQSK